MSLLAPILLATLLPLGSAANADDGATSGASLDITVYACPDGVDPTVDATGCTDVVDAAPGAMLGAAPDARMSLAEAERTQEGAYTFAWQSAPGDGSVGLSGFAPTDFNSFTFRGLDESHRWGGSVDFTSRAHRSVSVYYYNGNEPLITPGENQVTVSVFDCPAGVDPATDASVCTVPVPTGDLGSLGYEIGSPANPTGGSFADLASSVNGRYAFNDVAPYTKFGVYDTGQDDATYVVTGDIEEQRDDLGGGTAYLVRGESREIVVYRVAASDAPTGDTGTILVSLRSCPPGITNLDQVSPTACATVLQDDGTSRIAQGVIGTNRPLTDFPFQGDGYVIADLGVGDWTLSGVQPVDRAGVQVVGVDEVDGTSYLVHLEAGATRTVYVYYVDAA